MPRKASYTIRRYWKLAYNLLEGRGCVLRSDKDTAQTVIIGECSLKKFRGPKETASIIFFPRVAGDWFHHPRPPQKKRRKETRSLAKTLAGKFGCNDPALRERFVQNYMPGVLVYKWHVSTDLDNKQRHLAHGRVPFRTSALPQP